MPRPHEGSRVRLRREVAYFPIGTFPVGLTGRLVNIGEDGDHWVKLDQHFPGLDPWDNQLQIWDWSEQDSPDEHPSAYLEVIGENELHSNRVDTLQHPGGRAAPLRRAVAMAGAGNALA